MVTCVSRNIFYCEVRLKLDVKGGLLRRKEHEKQKKKKKHALSLCFSNKLFKLDFFSYLFNSGTFGFS